MTGRRLVLILILAGTPVGTATAGKVQWKPVAPSDAHLLPNPMPHFGLGIDGQFVREGIEIRKAEPNRPAIQIGLEPGDVLVAANGRSLRQPRDWVDAMTGQDGRF